MSPQCGQNVWTPQINGRSTAENACLVTVDHRSSQQIPFLGIFCDLSWSAVHMDNSKLRWRISLEPIKQSTSGKRRYQLRFFPRSTKTIRWTLVRRQRNNLDFWLMTLKFNRFLEVIEIHVQAKFHQGKCSSLWVIVSTNFFALSGNGKKSDNPVLWPWRFTYDLEILWILSGCQQHVRAKFHRAKRSAHSSHLKKQHVSDVVVDCSM